MYLSISETVNEIQKSIRDAMISTGDISNVYKGVRYVVGVALIIFLFKETFTLLAKGGKEPIEPMKHIVTPLFFVLAYLVFPDVLHWISIWSNQMGKTLLGSDLTDNYVAQMNNLLIDIKMGIIQEFTAKEGFWEKLSALSFQKFFVTFILELMSDTGLFLDRIFIYLFAAYSSIMVELLKVVGSIALVLSFIPGMKGVFITWLKAFISVNLWFGIGALIFRLINSMSLAYFNYVYNNIDDGNFTFSMALGVGWLFIALGIFKGIMMFKVPQTVAMFIGSSSSGGMFGAAFAPVMMAMAATKGVASAAGKIAGGFKSK